MEELLPPFLHLGGLSLTRSVFCAIGYSCFGSSSNLHCTLLSFLDTNHVHEGRHLISPMSPYFGQSSRPSWISFSSINLTL